MKFWLKQYIYLLPCICLGVDFLALWLPSDFDYVVLCNIAGYSWATNLVFIYIFTLGNYCWFTKLAPIGMCAINLVNIIGHYFPDPLYKFWYIVTVLCVILSLTLILELSKRIKK